MNKFLVVVSLCAISLFFGCGSAVAYGNEKSNMLFEQISKLAKKGDTKAQYSLGVMYEKGEGIGPDPDKAVFWYLKAAKKGMPWRRIIWGLCILKVRKSLRIILRP